MYPHTSLPIPHIALTRRHTAYAWHGHAQSLVSHPVSRTFPGAQMVPKYNAFMWAVQRLRSIGELINFELNLLILPVAHVQWTHNRSQTRSWKIADTCDEKRKSGQYRDVHICTAPTARMC
jgi:hypothetical protein